jgi:hypothetical protein
MKLFRMGVMVLALSMTLAAQGPGGGNRPGGNTPGGGNGPNGDAPQRPQPEYSELAETLRLTQEQIDQLNDIRRRFAEEIQGNVQAIGEKMRAAQMELRSEVPSATAIGQLQLDALEMRKSVRAMEDDFVAESQAVLSAQQNAALSSLTRIAPYMRHVRQGQSLGLIAGDDGEFSLGGGRGGPGAGRGRRAGFAGAMGPGGPRGGQRPGGPGGPNPPAQP